MALNSFLKIDGIDGESADKTHPGEIEVVSFSWGVSNSGGVSGPPGRASLQDFHFTMATSKASPNLMLACATGRHIRFATLTCRRNATGPGGVGLPSGIGAFGSFEFLKIKLSDCLVSLYELGSHVIDTSFSLLPGNENSSTDQLGITFGRIEYAYTVERTREIITTMYDTED